LRTNGHRGVVPLLHPVPFATLRPPPSPILTPAMSLHATRHTST
jgi:hypothetical protein